MTPQSKDKSSEIKKGSLSEITVHEPGIEKLRSTEKNKRLEGYINGYLLSKLDIFEEFGFGGDVADEFTLWLQKDYFVEKFPFMELVKKYPSINMIHLLFQLERCGKIREKDTTEIQKYFSDKGIKRLQDNSKYELKEFEKGQSLSTINEWREEKLEREREIKEYEPILENKKAPKKLVKQFKELLRKEYIEEDTPFMELVEKHPQENLVMIWLALGDDFEIDPNDYRKICEYFKTKGLSSIEGATRNELIRFDKGLLGASVIEKQSKQRAKKVRLESLEQRKKEEKDSKIKAVEEKDTKEIKHLEGNKNILVIAPHGVMGDDDHTNIIAEELNKKFGCYAVINEKYRRPKEDEGEKSDPSKFILDLNVISDAKQVEGNEFLGWIDKYSKEIIKNYDNPLVFHIHGISENIKKVAKIADDYNGKPEDLDILIGHGQWEDNTRLTAEESTVKSLIQSLKDNIIEAIRAPVRRIHVDGKWKLYCGNDQKRMNQYFRINKINVQSIQLEIKKSRFREDPVTARKEAEPLGEALSTFSVTKAPAGEKEEGAFWLTSAKHTDAQIKVKEIDLSDMKFKSRISYYGVDQENFDNLVKDIKSKGILQNIIVRKVPDKEKLQLISGFRRLSALEKAFEEQGEKDAFQETLVPVKIFESLSNEEAHGISFSENLQREDLSLWEMANSCRNIREEILKSEPKTPKSDIEKRLVELTRRKPRTVRTYLLVGGIQNEGIRERIHTGKIDISLASIFARSEFNEEDRLALLKYFQKRRMSFREFEKFVRNLLELRSWSVIAVEKILEMPGAHNFLALDPQVLKEKVNYLKETTNKPIDYILAHYAGHLKKSLDNIKTQDEIKPFMERFIQQSKSMEEKISQVWKTKRVGADIKIQPAKDIQDKSVEVTIAAPVDSIQAAIGLVAEELKDDFASLEKIVHDLLNDPAYKEAVKKPKAYGTMEWSAHNVNCCTGCSHDCRYCYAKSMAVRFGRLTHDQWKEERIRQEDVDKEYRLMKKQVMFPSSHDITPTNLRACRIVLGKLLQVGNRVLIVSKPHLECISKLCEDSAGYKDKILFRFSITACDDEILSFWEPHSPRYKERKEALKYAYEAGFQTSVSVEPMLDSAHIEDLVEDLSPLVTDTIWIGKMNHLGSIQKDDDAVAEAVKKIEAGQTDDKIQVIYEKYKDNPLIKWKSSIKKIVGIPLPTEPGLDI
jgi:ParB/RepB/Spo0J family partition protein